MTAAKWRVRKDRWPDGDEDGGWFVFPPGKDWEQLWHSDIALFGGHSEALAYADRMARTVEVELPRPDSNVRVYATAGKFMGIQLDGEWTVITRNPEETALALLALARRKEQA